MTPTPILRSKLVASTSLALLLASSSAMAQGQGAANASPNAHGVGLIRGKVAASCGSLLPAAGLSYHLLTRQHGNLSWDYDPPGDTVTRVVGSYDHHAQTFSWQETYHPDHFRVSTVVTGTGGIDDDGNEVTAYTVTTTDKLGKVSVTEIELQRTGCSMSRSFRAQGDPTWHVHTGTFGAAGYSYQEWQNPELWVGIVGQGWPNDASGMAYPDASYHETFAAPPSGYDDETDDSFGPWVWYNQTVDGSADGSSTTSYHWNNDWGTQVTGTVHALLDGTRTRHEHVSTEDWGWTTDYTRSYEGYGTGTFSAWFYDPQIDDWYFDACPITMTPTSCDVTCTKSSFGCWFL